MIDKPHFAAAQEVNIAPGEFAHPSSIQTSEPVGDNAISNAQVSDAGSNSTLDLESLAALRNFFELLDEWDHKEKQP